MSTKKVKLSEVYRKLKVEFPDGTSTVLSEKLILKNTVSDENIELLRHSHIYKWQLYKEMEEASTPSELQVLAKKVEALEFYQQELWGFPKNASFHKFWLMPQCDCPAMDNSDLYGTGHRVYAEHCPIHGEGWVT